MAADWKDLLARLASSLPEATVENHTPDNTPSPEGSSPKTDKLPCVTIFYEKKGRGGKEVTIIEGFGEKAEEIARLLKQRLGCGGSHRQGDILLQGDRRRKAAEILHSLGYKTKGT